MSWVNNSVITQNLSLNTRTSITASEEMELQVKSIMSDLIREQVEVGFGSGGGLRVSIFGKDILYVDNLAETDCVAVILGGYKIAVDLTKDFVCDKEFFASNLKQQLVNKIIEHISHFEETKLMAELANRISSLRWKYATR